MTSLLMQLASLFLEPCGYVEAALRRRATYVLLLRHFELPHMCKLCAGTALHWSPKVLRALNPIIKYCICST